MFEMTGLVGKHLRDDWRRLSGVGVAACGLGLPQLQRPTGRADTALCGYLLVTLRAAALAYAP